MGTKHKQPLNLRDTLANLSAGILGVQTRLKSRNTFWVSGDGVTTTFPLPVGWKPVNVFVDGALFRPGAGEDYTVAFDGQVHAVRLAVAPAAVDIAILAEES
ncbi:hypothetical protein FAP39_13675 [Shimia litoralis]|uniref:Uncharacterized protein n=1 Tax=Shimia litoralis TaxID=420403 RepID=A0A4V6F157_9RHOB|nr:hypothetical protein [Shimia litoralis]TKZ18001.1 hypothetical protein FAP39_13675 [Shimia litoralis]